MVFARKMHVILVSVSLFIGSSSYAFEEPAVEKATWEKRYQSLRERLTLVEDSRILLEKLAQQERLAPVAQALRNVITFLAPQEWEFALVKEMIDGGAQVIELLPSSGAEFEEIIEPIIQD
jgi:hypothetical protein